MGGETSAQIPKLKFKLRAQQKNPIIHVPTYNEIERDHLTEAKQISFAVAESVKKADAIENITLVKEFVLAEVVKQMVVGDGEGEESDSYDTFLLNQEDLDIRLESVSHKESPNEMLNVRELAVLCVTEYGVLARSIRHIGVPRSEWILDSSPIKSQLSRSARLIDFSRSLSKNESNLSFLNNLWVSTLIVSSKSSMP
ncbi:hypothetical protein Tco_1417213 [Tanacetum coccineum]